MQQLCCPCCYSNNRILPLESNRLVSLQKLLLFSFQGFLPPPLSQQQLVDCTAGLTVDNGTELERSNQGCVSGFPDVHLKFVKEQGGSIQTAEE
jgi:hypothetical protein